MTRLELISEDSLGRHYLVLSEDGLILGTIDGQTTYSDAAKYFAWGGTSGDRYLGQAETVDYCLRYFS